MFFIAGQEEDYGTGSFSSVLNTPYPLTHFPLLVLPVLAQYLWSVFSPWFGALATGAIITYTSFLISARYCLKFPGHLVRSNVWLLGYQAITFFHFEGGQWAEWQFEAVFCSTCELLWSLPRSSYWSIPPPTAVGVQNIVSWNLRLALLIWAFHTLNCLLTALPNGPNCILWAKTKIWLASFSLEFSLNCMLLLLQQVL